MTNLYSGEIFSCLSLQHPVSVPRTFQDLADSDVAIFTRALLLSSSFIDARLLSLLKDGIIPDLISNFKGNEEFISSIVRINKLFKI